MFFACGIWCVADVSSASPSSEKTVNTRAVFLIKPKEIGLPVCLFVSFFICLSLCLFVYHKITSQ